MGNQLVIPSQGNWYEEPLRKNRITVKKCIDSGTFFLTLDCINFDGESLIVKAYEYTEPLDKVHVTDNCRSYFSILDEKYTATQGIINYQNPIIFDRYAFLVRPKLQYTLPERLEEYPRLEVIEKIWVIYQILSSIISLHTINLVHGALNPDNVFCDWDTRVTIGDMAPFKPSLIRCDKPNVFYHYFSTSSRTGCYLAPEQIADTSLIDDVLMFNKPSYAADFFSIGCIIYFIFTGEHLFSFSSLISYAHKQKDIENELQKLPVCIRGFTKSLLSLNPADRDPSELLHTTFPSCFNQIFNQFLEFSMNDGSLTHFVTMIPVFNAMVEEQDVEVRVILTNLFSRFLLTSDDQYSIVEFSYFLVEFASPLSEEIIICRILPNIVGLFSFDSNTIKSVALRCLVKLLESCRSVNQDLQSIIENYIVNESLNIYNFTTLQSKCAFAETCPKFIYQVMRLIPNITSKISCLAHFIINENEVSVISAFLYGLNQCTKGGYLLFSALFPILLSSSSHLNPELTTKLFHTIKHFYDDSTKTDQNLMKPMLANLVSATLGFLHTMPKEEMSIAFLEIIEWVTTIDVFDETLSAETFITLSPIMDSGEKSTCFIASKIINTLTPFFKNSILPNFVLKSINKQSSVITIEEAHEISIGKSKTRPSGVNFNQIINKPKTAITVTPKMLYSIKPTNRPIKCIAGTDDFILISNGYDMFALTKHENEPELITVENNEENIIKSMSTLQNTRKTIVCYKDTTALYDMQEMKLQDQISNSYDFVKAIDTNIYVTSKNNNFFICDVRQPQKTFIQHITFDDGFQTITDVCSWNNDNVLLGIGFEEGFVYTFDTRVSKPLSLSFSPSVRNLSPVYSSEESTLCFVTSETVSACLDIETQKTVIMTNIGGFSDSLEGRIIIASDDGVYLINPFNMHKSFLLSDALFTNNFGSHSFNHKMIPLKCEKSQKIKGCFEIMKNDKQNITNPLHGHSSHITALSKTNHFVTGDTNGFVNIWSV